MLSIQEMPASFVGQGLLWGAKSPLLNPINKNQGNFNRYVGKPVRCVVRIVHEIGLRFIAPFGMAYHIGRSVEHVIRAGRTFDYMHKAKMRSLAWENLKATFNDLYAITTSTFFSFQPNISVAAYLNNSYVKFDPLLDSDIAKLAPHVVKHKKSSLHDKRLEHMKRGIYEFDILTNIELGMREVEVNDNKTISHNYFVSSYVGF